MDRRGVLQSKNRKKDREIKGEEGRGGRVWGGGLQSNCLHQLCPSPGPGHQVERQRDRCPWKPLITCSFSTGKQLLPFCVLIQCFELQVYFSSKILCVSEEIT